MCQPSKAWLIGCHHFTIMTIIFCRRLRYQLTYTESGGNISSHRLSPTKVIKRSLRWHFTYTESRGGIFSGVFTSKNY